MLQIIKIYYVCWGLVWFLGTYMGLSLFDIILNSNDEITVSKQNDKNSFIYGATSNRWYYLYKNDIISLVIFFIKILVWV